MHLVQRGAFLAVVLQPWHQHLPLHHLVKTTLTASCLLLLLERPPASICFHAYLLRPSRNDVDPLATDTSMTITRCTPCSHLQRPHGFELNACVKNAFMLEVCACADVCACARASLRLCKRRREKYCTQIISAVYTRRFR